jgi:hypothetical protein
MKKIKQFLDLTSGVRRSLRKKTGDEKSLDTVSFRKFFVSITASFRQSSGIFATDTGNYWTKTDGHLAICTGSTSIDRK